jgi:hypothetical protein
VVMSGEFADVTTDEEKALINPISSYYKKWWYTHVEDISRSEEARALIRTQLYTAVA